ncbi:hypothetical protein AB0C04_28085 [Micromonospora sp. NPDC048909]|uniref:hypothetical protein n=1 Tax=Micromonospora sp. NPDC048909 TaxID=3155643 RepID=UPI0033F4A6DE
MPWTPIRTMRRGQRPDFTLRRQPPNNYITNAQQWLMDQLLDLEPGSEDVDGGRYAHKPGYHDTVAHNDARSGVGKDYSARDPEDRRGPHNKTRAFDWTFRDAQAGRFADFEKYGDRLLAAYRANDPRLAGWREYLGRVSKAVTINGKSTRRVGIDFRKRSLRIPDSTHEWHGHGSEDTEQVESFANKWKLLTILAGWSLAEWQQSTTDTGEDTMAMSQADKVAWATTNRTDALLSGKDASYQIEGEKTRRNEPNQVARALARIETKVDAAIKAAQGGDGEEILARINEVAAESAQRDAQTTAELAALADQLDQVAEMLRKLESGELTAEQVLVQLRELLPVAPTS